MAINNKLLSLTEDFGRPILAPSITNVVTITPSSLIGDMAKVYIKELGRVTNYQDPDINELTSDDIEKYLNTLTFMRVQRVNGELQAEFNKIYSKVFIPVLFYQVINEVGEAVDRDYGVTYKPAIKLQGTDILSVQEMMAISDVMTRVQQLGFFVVKGLPNALDGSLEMMVMRNLEGTITSYKISHPVYASLMAFFRTTVISDVTGTMQRIRYGTESDYAVNLTALIKGFEE